jgi:hypothetical protein
LSRRKRSASVHGRDDQETVKDNHGSSDGNTEGFSKREHAPNEERKHDRGNERWNENVIEHRGLTIPEEEEENETRQIEGLQESAYDSQREGDTRNEGENARAQQCEDQFSEHKTPSNRNIGSVCCKEVSFPHKC